MAGFDKSKDKVVKSKELVFGEDTKIIVSVMCYNEGLSKLQLQRLRYSNNDEEFVFLPKIGRLTKEETIKVIEAMSEMLGELD
jgi:hypothetical protein